MVRIALTGAAGNVGREVIDSFGTDHDVVPFTHSETDKVERAMATTLYGAMADFYTSERLDDLMYESTERAKLLLEAEGATVDVEREIEVEDAVHDGMSEIRRRSGELCFDEPECPHCGGDFLDAPEEDAVDVEVPEDLEAWKREFPSTVE